MITTIILSPPPAVPSWKGLWRHASILGTGENTGEIQVRGENVMKGYYKNPEATAAAFTDDGWLKQVIPGSWWQATIHQGRIKSMLLTANGQNVYPEEIESRLNNLPYVAESVVVLRDFRLVAMVYPDMPLSQLTRSHRRSLLPSCKKTGILSIIRLPATKKSAR